MSVQDGIAFGIVGVAAGAALRSLYLRYGVGPLSRFLLKRGKVGLAMRVRGGRPPAKDCGGDCSCD